MAIEVGDRVVIEKTKLTLHGAEHYKVSVEVVGIHKEGGQVWAYETKENGMIPPECVQGVETEYVTQKNELKI